MNTYTKFIPQLLAVVLFLSIIHPVIGQDFIRGAIDFYICDTSIVRGISKDTTLIYNRLNRNRGLGSTFSLVTVGNSNALTVNIENDSIFVNDFEFYKRIVYFCGFIRTQGEKKAIVGYFKFDPFPNNNIYYYLLDDCQELKKIDVYHTIEFQDYGEIRMVATGTSSGTRSDILVDITTNTLFPTNCDIHFSDDENENFDDVAVTDKYVVVSSRTIVLGIPVVNFWYFRRPHYVGQDIFSSSSNRFRISSPMAESPVILEYTKNNSFAAVYKKTGFNQIAMLRLEAMNPYYSIFEMVEDTLVNVYPMDIKYNTKDTVYSILARAGSLQNLPPYVPYMQIYHVTKADLDGSTSNGQGKKYTEIFYKLWSLDFWLGPNRQFVASGDEGKIPKMFRFDHLHENTCSEKFVYPHYNGKLDGETKEISIVPYSLFLPTNRKETEEKEIPFPQECGKEFEKTR